MTEKKNKRAKKQPKNSGPAKPPADLPQRVYVGWNQEAVDENRFLNVSENRDGAIDGSDQKSPVVCGIYRLEKVVELSRTQRTTFHEKRVR